LLAPRYTPVPRLWDREPLALRIEEVATGSFRRRDPPEIRGSGYVVRSLEAALWAFDRSDSFRDGALRAVNLGRDADTTGAVFGQLAGAHYGTGSIPPAWRDRLALRDLIERFDNWPPLERWVWMTTGSNWHREPQQRSGERGSEECRDEGSAAVVDGAVDGIGESGL